MRSPHRKLLASHIGERLLELRLDMDITQGQLAVKIGVSKSCLGYMERGVSVPTADTMFLMSRFFEVEPGYWFDGYEVPKTFCDDPYCAP